MSTESLFGSDEADRRHHPTGRDAYGDYLDPDLIAPCTHSEHETVHDDWKTLGLENPIPTPSFLERLELGLRRLGAFLGRLATSCQGSWAIFIGGLAAASLRWANGLQACRVALDAGAPGWRDLPGMP
ncbi:MAG: hypothetical protein WD096_02620 [Actinomycetota bacterium]